MNSHELGKVGQKAAETFLISKGCNIIDRNFHTRSGELDLVMRDGDYIVFVEVKARKGLEYGYPREAVTRTKQKRIVRTALAYLTRHHLTNSNIRFDVVEIIFQQDQAFASHIENAFTR